MLAALKAGGIVILGFIVAISIGFIVSPRDAAAPAETPPAVLAPEPKTPATATTSATTTTEPEAPVPVAPTPKPVPKTVSILTPGTPEYEKALKDALDALAKLNVNTASSSAPTSLNDRARAAVVNILCTSKAGGFENSITASGVVIDPRGVILTNSHVAQYLLLKNYRVTDFFQCTARTGSPARSAYRLELLYLPPSWIANNAQKIDDETPTGNGEHDYALVRITGTTQGEAVSALPYLALRTSPQTEGDEVLIVGYAAGFLGGAEILKDLYASSSYAKVREFYTYGGNSVDLFSLGGSVVAQQGSSGGAVADTNGSLVGIIVTSTVAADTGSRDLRALTIPYIMSDFEREQGTSLSSFLTHDLAQEAATFAVTVAPTLTQALVNVLEQ